MNGLLRAPHESELAFAFGNPEAAYLVGGVAPDVTPLVKLMVATWSAFAHNGDSNNPILPRWPRHIAGDGVSMMLSAAPVTERDPGGRARAALDGLPWYEYGMPASYLRP